MATVTMTVSEQQRALTLRRVVAGEMAPGDAAVGAGRQGAGGAVHDGRAFARRRRPQDGGEVPAAHDPRTMESIA
jgi:hypothetical protein